MGLASRSEVFLDSEMQLEGSALGAEPASFASREVIGLRDALKAENPRVEPLSPILLPGRHCQLDVVETPEPGQLGHPESGGGKPRPTGEGGKPRPTGEGGGKPRPTGEGGKPRPTGEGGGKPRPTAR